LLRENDESGEGRAKEWDDNEKKAVQKRGNWERNANQEASERHRKSESNGY
jgi:hypothetical protein